MDSQEAATQKLQAAIVDGRAENARYRQTELFRLHTALISVADELCCAIIEDAKFTKLEAETEYCMTMGTLKHFYESLDFDKELKDEYLVANGLDNTTRRIGFGLVVIRPSTHTRLFSIIAPMAAALAAGSCVLLELEHTLISVDTILKKVLPNALDQNTFFVSSERVTQPEILNCWVLVDQTTIQTPFFPRRNELLSSTQARTVAIVDRTADLEKAAQAIVAARFSFSGTSPYAPDLVIVNEFVKKDFFEACTRYASQAFVTQGSQKATPSNKSEDTRKLIKDAEAKGYLSTFGSSEFLLVDISERSSRLVDTKISGRYLPLVACSSLIDAVIVAQSTGSTLMAGYFFANPSAGKFLSQQINPYISCINQIPPCLLIGPPAPISHPPSLYYRYTEEMFTQSRPQFINSLPPNSTVSKVSQLLEGAQKDQPNLEILRDLATTPLKGTGQGDGYQVGFFEQGILTGFGVVGTIVLPTFGIGCWFLGKKCLELARR